MATQDNPAAGSSAAAPRSAGKWKRFLVRLAKRFAIVLVVFVIGCYFFGSAVLSRVIAWQLKSQLASRANANLETASVRYIFPYTVRIEKAQLVVPDTAEGRGWGIDVGGLELTLAKLPLGAGPLVIKSLEIDKPVIRLSAADNTAASEARPAAPEASSSPSSTASKKLSDLFRLDHVVVKDACVEFSPGTRMEHKPPVVWKNLSADMKIARVAGGYYDFHFAADDAPLASISADGAFDIDSLLLNMQKLSVAVKVAPNTHAEQLPPEVQALCEKFKISGQMDFAAAARVALTDPTHGIYTATLSLAHGTGEVPGLDQPISPAQFTMRCSNLPGMTVAAFNQPLPAELPKTAEPLHLWVSGLKVCSDNRLVQIDDGEIQFDPFKGDWSVQGLKGLVDGGQGPRPIVALDSHGKIDLSAMVLDLQKFTLSLQCKMNPPTAVASTANDPQNLVARLNVGGRLIVDAVAKVPLRSVKQALFCTRVSLQDGVGTVPGVPGTISPARGVLICSDLPGADAESIPTAITGKFPAQLPPVRMWIRKVDIGALKRQVQLDTGELGYDIATGAWHVTGLEGQFDAGTGPRPISSLTANGKIDWETDVLDVQKLSIRVQADPTAKMLAAAVAAATPEPEPKPAPRPANLSQQHSGSTKPATAPVTRPVNHELNIAGQVALDMVGKMPLKHPLCGLFAARLSVNNAFAQIPDVDGIISPAECQMTLSNLPEADHHALPADITAELPRQPAPLHLWLDKLKIISGKQVVDLEGGVSSFDPVAMTWKLDHLHGLIDAGNSPGPVRDANLLVKLPFTVAGSGRFDGTGAIFVPDDKSAIDLTLADGSVDATTNHIPFRDIEGVIELHPHEMVARQITGTSMGGNFRAMLDTSWRPIGAAKKVIPTYFGSINIVDLDLHRVAIVFTTDESTRAQTSGQMDFDLNYHGLIVPGAPASSTDSVMNQVGGSGDFDIHNGYFATIPVLKDVAASMQNFDAATIGQAAGQFTFAKQVVTFQKAAASAPALGVQGSGTVTFEQIADMTFVATPLADWGADVNALGNPALNGVANFFHKAEDQFNKVQAKALYQIKVTGPVTSLTVTPVPLPGVSDKVGGFFDTMSKDVNKGGDLLNKLKGQ